MSSDGHEQSQGGHRPAPEPPLVVNPAVPALVDVVPAGSGGKTLIPVLVLPGIRVCVDGFSTDRDASEWWKQLAVAALYAALCYHLRSEEPAR